MPQIRSANTASKRPCREFERLRTAYETLGYKVVLLPKKSVQTRADLVLSVLSSEKTVADRSS